MSSIFLKLQEFFKQKAIEGVLELRESELKDWAIEEHFSPTTLHKTLRKMVSWKHLLRIEKVMGGRLAVFYALNPPYRERFLEAFKDLHENLKDIDALSKTEKQKELVDMISFMMMRFADFVPFYIYHLLRGKVDDPEEFLENLWHWSLYPYLMEIAMVAVRNSSETWELPIIQSMENSYTAFLRSNSDSAEAEKQ